MSLTDFWEKLTPEEKEKLRPYLEAERAEMIKCIAREKTYYSKGKRRPWIYIEARRTLV